MDLLNLDMPNQQNQQWYFVIKIVQTYCEKKNVLVIKKNF